MNRRTYTKTCLTAAAGLLNSWRFVYEAGSEFGRPKRVPKTDTHVHLFDLDRFTYSWLKNAPEINRNFSVSDFQEASKKSNIGKILFMESGADAGHNLHEAEWVAGLVRREPRIKGIIAKLDLSQGSKTAADLERLAEIKILRGVRGEFPENGSNTSSFVRGLHLLAERNLTFDLLLTPPRLSFAAEVVKKCPDNIFVLDHFGNPDVKAGEMENWKRGIIALSDLPNVNCKLSGIITRAGKGWTKEKIEPYVIYVVEKFGMDRLVYGGDWPVVLRAGSYRSWSNVFEKITKRFAQDDLHKIYHRNADRIYNLS